MWSHKACKKHHVLKPFLFALLWVDLDVKNYVAGLPVPAPGLSFSTDLVRGSKFGAKPENKILEEGEVYHDATGT